MSNLKAEEYKSFVQIKKVREDGTEYWNARELSEVLQYVQWRNFAKVIDRAKLAYKNSGRNIDDDFAEVSKIVEAGATQKKVTNLFRISQTEEKLKKDKVHSCTKATATHYEVGSKVRKAIEDIGGTMPEDLPKPEKSIKQIEKEQLKRLKDKKTKLMLDE